MKILIACFSGTGNTERIAGLYENALSADGHEVTLIKLPLDDGKNIDTDRYDIIGIGYPIHAFNAPKIILDFCKKLEKRDPATKKRAFVFKTSGEPVRMSDVSSLKLKAILARRGYALENEYQYVMPYNIIFRHTDEQAYRMWQTARRLVPVDVKEITGGKRSLPRKMFMGGFLAWTLRVEHGGAKLIGRGFKTTDNCAKCGLCVRSCPTNNIKVNKKGKIKFGGNCMICMRCVFFCPENAIKPSILNGWKVNGAYRFLPPSELSPPSKHDNYCIKAYNRYYDNAERKINGTQE